MKCTTLFRNGGHRWLMFGQDPAKPGNVIDTNQVVICGGQSAILLDPGGMEVFPAMLGALSQEISVNDIRHLFLSHQDPDVGSSLPLWRKICDANLRIHVPWLWAGFLAHFDKDAKFETIPDEGREIALDGDVRLKFLPAHYLHSPGNHHVYDAKAKMLFTGDIGAALMPEAGRGDVFVSDFSSHIKLMEGFHRRWMGSTQARDGWIAMVSELDIDMLVPQHGLVFRGDDVKRFLDWFARLDICTGLSAFGRRA